MWSGKFSDQRNSIWSTRLKVWVSQSTSQYVLSPQVFYLKEDWKFYSFICLVSLRCYCVLHLDYRTKHSSKARNFCLLFLADVILFNFCLLQLQYLKLFSLPFSSYFPFSSQQPAGSNEHWKDYSTLIMEERFKAEERKEIIGEEWRKISKIFDRQIIFWRYVI